MTKSFYNGLSGMATIQKGINTWAHNISNANLAGYRASRPEFASMFSQSMASSGTSSTMNEVGSGITLQTTAMTRTQGSLTTTESVFDLAIDGNGWFGVFNEKGETLYTRNGSFNFDKDRYLVDKKGGYVTGQMAGNILFGANPEDNKLTGIVTDITTGNPTTQKRIKLPNMLSYPKKLTSTVSVRGNIGINDEVRKFSTYLISATDQKNILTTTMKKTKNQPSSGSSWVITAKITDENSKITYDSKQGIIEFNGDGTLKNSNIPIMSNDGTPISLDFGKGIAGLQANDSSPIGTLIEKDGHPKGNLNKYSVSQDGNIVAFFDNGHRTVVGKVAIYHFRNEQGLQEVGGSYFTSNRISGNPLFYKDKIGQLITKEGLVFDHHLEEGNINTTEALSELMLLQRAFDASSRSLTTGDDLIKTALQM
jgi:flagellar hook protein FlgE